MPGVHPGLVHLADLWLADFGRDDGPAVLEAWSTGLSDGGSELDPLQLRPWGDHDGQVTDRFGVRWLIGYQG